MTGTWYDSRRGKSHRDPEYRLYYPAKAEEVVYRSKEGDTLFLCLPKEGHLLAILCPAGSTIESQLQWLFGLRPQQSLEVETRELNKRNSHELDLAARYILDELGIGVEEPEDAQLDALIEPFGLMFPVTRVLSKLARNSLPDSLPLDAPDEAIVSWMEREEQLFRRLERRVVDARLRSGFMMDEGPDVDGFLNFSLSVQNRRKSRAGHALENHLEALFLAHKLRFARGVETENRNKPDFLFPGQTEYRDTAFPSERLTMLGAKSSLKDRWRQVLSEAVRIERKHLLTLEPGISENQTDEMRTKDLQLVIPNRLHQTFNERQRPQLMGLADFIGLVKSRERA
ncbi:MAG: type II restriction endonuclease [Beijerinckiaceae bacterium]